MKISKILTVAGLQARNKADWVNKVLLYKNEYDAIMADLNITHVSYDPGDGRAPLILNADKIRKAKAIWKETKEHGDQFGIFKEKDLV